MNRHRSQFCWLTFSVRIGWLRLQRTMQDADSEHEFHEHILNCMYGVAMSYISLAAILGEQTSG